MYMAQVATTTKMSVLCSLKNINLNFGQKKIFDQAEMIISQGERIGLIGLNGQGKSTLFKIINKEIIPEESNPAFIFDKANQESDIFLVPQEIDTKTYAHYTIQNFYTIFYPNLQKIQEQLDKIEIELATDFNDALLSRQEKLLSEFERQKGWDIQNLYLNYLKAFDLKDVHRSVEKLSGGEIRKMALSIGLSSPAHIILWDEPTNHLDIDTIEKFEEELLSSNKTFLVITHDRYLLNYTTDKILHIERGKINSFKGNLIEYMEYQEEKEKERLKNLSKLENRHRRELAWMRQGIKARGTRSKKRVESFVNLKSSIQEFKNASKKSAELSLAHSGKKSKLILEIIGGAFSFKEKTLFENVDIDLFKGDKVALMGENGAGKTTLINILQNTLSLGKGVYRTPSDVNIVVFSQNRSTLPLDKTPLEVVGDGVDFIVLPNGEQRHVISYLENFLFNSDQIHRPIYTLSGGEKNRLQLALFMKQSADLWIFDEPTNDLDIETTELLENELREYSAPLIIVSHDRAFLDNVCNKIWLINNKTIEQFHGNFSFIAPYLEQLKQEVVIEQNTKKNIKKEADQKQMTYQEKLRWQVIESEIEAKDLELKNLEEQMAHFDFTQASANFDFQKLTKQKTTLEKQHESLFAEWEKLSLKTP